MDENPCETRTPDQSPNLTGRYGPSSELNAVISVQSIVWNFIFVRIGTVHGSVVVYARTRTRIRTCVATIRAERTPDALVRDLSYFHRYFQPS